MPDLFGVGAALLTGWVLTYLVHSTVLIGLVWIAVSLNWVRAPEAKDFLWKFVLLAGAVSATGAHLPIQAFGAEAGIEMMARMEHVEGVASIERMEVAGPNEWVERGSGDIEAGTLTLTAAAGEPSDACQQAIAAGPGAPGHMERIRAACEPKTASSWYHVMLLLWGLGGFGLLALIYRDSRAVAAIRRSLSPAGERPVRLLNEITRGTRLEPRLMTSLVLDAPCVVDARTIALPVRCALDLTDDELRAVLAHEVAHVSRRDVAWLRVARVFSAVFWLQPLNRVAVRGLVDAAELVCDDWALSRTRKPLGLARSISRVAEWAVVPSRRPTAVVAMAGGDGRSLSNRVRRILSGGAGRTGSSRWQRWAGAGGLLLAVLLLPSVPGPAALHLSVFVAEENVIVRQIGSLEGGPSTTGQRQIRLQFSGDALPGRSDLAPNAVFIRRFSDEQGPAIDAG